MRHRLLLPLRVSVCWQNADSADSVFCGFNSDVSSDTVTFDGVITSSVTAWEVKSGDLMCVDADRTMPIWCKAADSAGAVGVLLSVQQFGKMNP